MSVWKTITECPNYEVSDAGEVRNVRTGRVLKGILKDGYHRVMVYPDKKCIYIHRLVALHFIENPENKPYVDHIDRDRTNNHVSNLRWATNSENGLNTDYRIAKTDSHHIWITAYQTFHVNLRGRTAVSKCFKTLDEAITFRDQWMTDNPR